MSSTFIVRGGGVSILTMPPLRRAVPYPFETDRDAADEDSTDIPPLQRAYRPGLSARAVEIGMESGAFNVRILSCSAPEDHDLALALVAAAASLAGVDEVELEGDDPLPIETLHARYDATWIREEVAFGARTVATLIDEEPGRVLRLDGPVRPFVIGRRLLDELRSSGPADGFPGRLIDAMRRTQWPGDAFRASVLSVSGAEGKSVRLAVLAGESRTVLPDVDAIVVNARNEPIYVRPEVVIRGLPGNATFLDERHILVEPVEPSRWAQFLAEARSSAIALDDL